MTSRHYLHACLLLVVLLSGLLLACANRQPAPEAVERDRSTALETRSTSLRADLDRATLTAAAEAAAAAGAQAAGRDREAQEHAQASRVAAAQAKALSEALARNEAAAATARTELHQVAQEAQEQAASATERANREWDRRACWWAGAIGAGAGVLVAGLALWVGVSWVPGAAIVAAGLAMHVFAQAAWVIVPLVVVTGAAVAVILLRQRLALHVAVSPTSGWQAAAKLLPATVRKELDDASLAAQKRLPGVGHVLNRVLQPRGE